jgi:YHS domain-containing protein
MVIGLQGQQTPLHCVTTLEDITGEPATSLSYGGAMFGTCCGGCGDPFAKDPKGAIAKAAKANKAIGVFQYDPISGARINAKKAAGYSDYKAYRYFFASADEKKQFDATPAKYVTEVKSEAYFCPVMKHATTSDKAGAYADYKGVRYYTCCGDCLKAFNKNPDSYIANSASAVKPLAVVEIKK